MSKHAEKIAVIGAGFSGLTCAYRLNKKYNVEVYEARNRVGGRVQSILIKNLEGKYSIGELGAQNITDGGDSHMLEKLAVELGLEVENYNFNWNSQSLYKGEFIYANPKRIAFVKKHPDILTKLHEVAKLSTNMQQILDKLIDDEFIKHHFSNILNGYEGSSPEKLALTHNLETLESLFEGSISIAHRLEEENPVFKLASIKGGNAKFAESLAQKLAGRIHLNKALKQVKKLAGQFELSFEDGSTTHADKLILSIPASVFQDIQFAEDVIPASRLQKINQVQYGMNGKILVAAGAGETSESSVRIVDANTFFNNDSKLLNIFITNENGKIEQSSQYFDKVYPDILRGYGYTNAVVTKPVIALDENYHKYDSPVAKSWANDRFSKGSYSNFGVILGEEFKAYKNFRGAPFKEIFYPINDQIFFIGEHTTLIDAIGTMEAAVESAERLAKVFQ